MLHDAYRERIKLEIDELDALQTAYHPLLSIARSRQPDLIETAASRFDDSALLFEQKLETYTNTSADLASGSFVTGEPTCDHAKFELTPRLVNIE